MGESDKDRYLEIYLRDHHAGAVGALELLDRMRKQLEEDEASPLSEGLEWLREQLVQDVSTLEAYMDRFNTPPSQTKDAVSWTLEKLGRLKLNGEVTERSPLSRVLEVEGLAAGIQAKRQVWTTLLALSSPSEPASEAEALNRLVQRAEAQADVVRRMHEQAARRLGP